VVDRVVCLLCVGFELVGRFVCVVRV
jgi:hypothetical protein